MQNVTWTDRSLETGRKPMNTNAGTANRMDYVVMVASVPDIDF